MVIPIVIPSDKITKNQLEELNIIYNGNLISMTDDERYIWKSLLIKNGYEWNDLDGWGFWSIKIMLNKTKKNNIKFKHPYKISSIKREILDDEFNEIYRHHHFIQRNSIIIS